MRTIRWVVHSYLKEKEKFRQVPQIKFFMHAVRRFMLEFIEIVFFFMQTHEKETQLCNYVLCAKSAFVRQSTECYPSHKTTTTRGLIVGFFDLKHMSVNHYPVRLSAADILLAVLDPAPPPPPPPQEAVTN